MSEIQVPPERPFVVIGKTKGGQAVAELYPFWGEGAPMYFWAEQGLVLWENSRENCPPDKRFGSMTWYDAGVRVRSLSQMIFKSAEKGYYRDEANRLKGFISEMEDVIRTAKEQGSPFDEEAAEEYRRRRPKTVIMPQVVDLTI